MWLRTFSPLLRRFGQRHPVSDVIEMLDVAILVDPFPHHIILVPKG